MKTRALGTILVLALSAASCKASLNAEARVGKEDEVDFDEPISEATAGMAEDEGYSEGALLGARHDLTVASNIQKSPTCNCIFAAVGSASDPRFEWQSRRPRTNPNTQLVIALTSEGMPCEGVPEGSLGASYWGYVRSGDDIVVLVETARAGRPITSGAIIPKPFGDGQVLIRPASRKTPFGRPLNKDTRNCELGNPGGVRTAESRPGGVDFEE